MNFNFTSSAAKQVEKIAKLDSKDPIFRLSVDGGGCSGFQYKMELSAINDDDIIFKNGNSSLVIDKISSLYLEDSELDYVNELIGSFFKVKNPNASSSCGCGTSFAI